MAASFHCYILATSLSVDPKNRYTGHCKVEIKQTRACVVHSCSRSPSLSSAKQIGVVDRDYLVSDHGWKVRRLTEENDEMREATNIQAEAFHTPVALFNDFFFDFFKAEVLSGLIYKLSNSPPNRYACLVAETCYDSSDCKQKLVGIVDVTVLRDEVVLQHLPEGAEEYLYVSGIAVLQKYRRQKVASALLKACDELSIQWGYDYLVLRAYDDDMGARKLYSNAGYKVVSGDPHWITTWIGRKRRILLIKRSDSSTQES